MTFDDLIAPIFRVRITAGNTDIGSGLADDPLNGIDLVAIDDLLYSEPQAVSEPAVMALMSFGLIAMYRRKRRNLAN